VKDEAGHVTRPLTVLYDGSCPLCRREIGIYQDLQARQPVCFVDISQASQPVPAHTTRPELLARFHVQRADGRLLSGAPAFLELWSTLPGWRWLARLGRLPGVSGLLERSYRAFLHVRPALQRWARKLEG
jgi:predicted DCC family thiol-disulfide oxidoreductase YuxK